MTSTSDIRIYPYPLNDLQITDGEKTISVGNGITIESEEVIEDETTVEKYFYKATIGGDNILNVGRLAISANNYATYRSKFFENYVYTITLVEDSGIVKNPVTSLSYKYDKYDIKDSFARDGIADIDGKLNTKANIASTLEGYGILDAYTKTEIDDQFDSKLNNLKNDLQDEIGIIGQDLSDEIERAKGVEDGLQEQKLNKISDTDSNKVYGTEVYTDQYTGEKTVIQTAYDVDSFGKVDDVKVGNNSVVVNKIATLGTMAGESKDDYVLLSTYNDEVGDLQTQINDIDGEAGTITEDLNGEIERAKEVEGELDNLTTTSKDNLVSAINELNSSKQNNLTAGRYIDITDDVISSDASKVSMVNWSESTPSSTDIDLKINKLTVAEYQELVENNLINQNELYLTIDDIIKVDWGNINGDLSNQGDLQNALNNRVITTNNSNRVYGTDVNGNQITYDYNSFGKVDDVKVGNNSVVVNKIATLGTMAGESKDDYVLLTTYNDKVSEIENELEESSGSIEEEIGELDNLTTTSKDNLVSAINEVVSNNNTLSSDLSDEIARAKEVEGKLDNLTTTSKDNLVSAINEVVSTTNTISTNLTNEINRAIESENGLSSAISDAVNLINAEESRAINIENGLRTDLNAHIDDLNNPHKVSKSQVGLGNVDNTSDLNKPISTATQTALDKKVSDVKINDETIVENMIVNLGTMSKANTTSYYTKSEIDAILTASMHFKGTKETYNDLINIENPAIGDVYNILDTGSNYAWDGEEWDKLSETYDLTRYDEHLENTSNPHNVTKSQVGLGNVDNTSDLNKPISIATQTALDTKITHYSEMPTASSDNENEIVQYIGETNSNYHKGYFYKCVGGTSIENWVEFEPSEKGGIICSCSLSDFKSFVETHIRSGEDYRDITYAHIGVYGPIDRYIINGEVVKDGERLLTWVGYKSEFESLGFTFSGDGLVAQDGLDIYCALDKEVVEYHWQQVNVQPETDITNKLDKITSASKVYGTDVNGNQTAYDYDSFGKVDDVKVGNNSVVVNKIATLGTMAGESKDDYSTKAVADTLYANINLESTVDDLEEALANEIERATDAESNLNSKIETEIDDRTTAITTLTTNKADKSTTYTKTEVDGMLSGAMHFRGVVNTVEDLEDIENPAVGDLYNVRESGANYAWDGEEWVKMAENIDLSAYALTSYVDEQILAEQTARQNADNTKVTKVDYVNVVYGTDSQGLPFTYGISLFGKIDDVVIKDGDSLVSNRIATLGTMANKSSSDYYIKTDFANVATSGSYNDLTDTPTLANVATSGEYSDLLNIPDIAQSDWNETNTSSAAYIVNKPSIDQTYNAISTNAQSGTAVGEAIDGKIVMVITDYTK